MRGALPPLPDTVADPPGLVSERDGLVSEADRFDTTAGRFDTNQAGQVTDGAELVSEGDGPSGPGGGTIEPYYVSSPGELSAALESILDRIRAEIILQRGESDRRGGSLRGQDSRGGQRQAAPFGQQMLTVLLHTTR